MNKFREARKQHGLTIVEAARKVETNIGNLSRIERGQQVPTIRLAMRLCSLYGLSLDEAFADYQEVA